MTSRADVQAFRQKLADHLPRVRGRRPLRVDPRPRTTFRRTGALVEIDPRDRSWMASVPSLKRVGRS
jgi:hypothetical protein